MSRSIAARFLSATLLAPAFSFSSDLLGVNGFLSLGTGDVALVSGSCSHFSTNRDLNAVRSILSTTSLSRWGCTPFTLPLSVLVNGFSTNCLSAVRSTWVWGIYPVNNVAFALGMQTVHVRRFRFL